MKYRNKLLSFLIFFIIILSSENVFSQPATFRGSFNGWGAGNSLTDRGGVRAIRIQENTTGSRDFKFEGGGTWWGSGAAVNFQTRYSGVMTTSGGNSNYSSTNNNYYTFIVQDATGSLDVSILELTNNFISAPFSCEKRLKAKRIDNKIIIISFIFLFFIHNYCY